VQAEAHVLVVDDEAELRDVLREYLSRHRMEVSAADGGPAMREIMASRPVDLVILDVRMPGEDGLSLARELRAKGGVGIVMLTAEGETVDRIIGLEVGADDYLPKPFDPRELLARVRSVLRRTKPAALPSSAAAPPVPAVAPRREVRFGRCVLDLDARRLRTADGGEDVPITAMEFDLLEVFAANPDRVLSRDRLLDLAHRRDEEPFERSIDIRVSRLRRKVETDPAKPAVIKTVRGGGYVFVPARAAEATG
jgi:two-component system phosphate regulon response regulator OmpR